MALLIVLLFFKLGDLTFNSPKSNLGIWYNFGLLEVSFISILSLKYKASRSSTFFLFTSLTNFWCLFCNGLLFTISSSFALNVTCLGSYWRGGFMALLLTFIFDVRAASLFFKISISVSLSLCFFEISINFLSSCKFSKIKKMGEDI